MKVDVDCAREDMQACGVKCLLGVGCLAGLKQRCNGPISDGNVDPYGSTRKYHQPSTDQPVVWLARRCHLRPSSSSARAAPSRFVSFILA